MATRGRILGEYEIAKTLMATVFEDVAKNIIHENELPTGQVRKNYVKTVKTRSRQATVFEDWAENITCENEI